MTVTHIQLLLGKRGGVDKETDREKKGLVYSLFKDGKGLLKFYCIQMWLIPSALSWDRVAARIYYLYNPKPRNNWSGEGVGWGSESPLFNREV